MGVVFLGIGAFIEVLDLTAAAMASFLVIFAVLEMKGKYPYFIYAATALLSFLLLPLKTPALFYAVLFGYYPILKQKLEVHLRRPIAWLIKILFCNAVLALLVFLLEKIFMPGVPILGEGYGHGWLLLCTPVFILYDIALTRLITFYIFRLRKRLRFLQNEP